VTDSTIVGSPPRFALDWRLRVYLLTTSLFPPLGLVKVSSPSAPEHLQCPAAGLQDVHEQAAGR